MLKEKRREKSLAGKRLLVYDHAGLQYESSASGDPSDHAEGDYA